MRVRTGIVRDDEGWWVFVDLDGKPYVYGRTGGLPFVSEAEAEAKAAEIAKVIRDTVGAQS
jgi:hypothetical protein